MARCVLLIKIGNFSDVGLECVMKLLNEGYKLIVRRAELSERKPHDIYFACIKNEFIFAKSFIIGIHYNSLFCDEVR